MFLIIFFVLDDEQQSSNFIPRKIRTFLFQNIFHEKVKKINYDFSN